MSNEMNVQFYDIEDISPYDPSYPIVHLENGLKQGLNKARNIINTVVDVIQKESPILTEIHQAMKKGCRYVVDMSENTMESIDSGKIKLSMDKAGKTYAQIREKNGQYGAKLPIKKEMFRKGIDPVQMANALQMQALEEQIKTISDQINIIDHNVKDVLQGLQNDRIGLYYSGLSLYLEACNINNPEMRQLLLVQSLRTLSDASAQLTLTMQADIQYLGNKGYKSHRGKGKSLEELDSRMVNINRSFAFIHQATLLRAAIYCNTGELAAMSSVLKEYSYFIENTIAKNATMLAQCDVNDMGAEVGIWKTRARLSLDVDEFSKQIGTKEKVFYLGFEGDK